MNNTYFRLKELSDHPHRRQCLVLFLLLSGFVFVSFCVSTYRCALLTDDDAMLYLYSLNSNYMQYAISNAIQQGRVMSFLTAYLARLPFLTQTLLGYKLFTYGSLLLVAASISTLCYRHIGKAVGGLAFLLFFSMAQIDVQHNLFFSYVLTHQIPLALLFFSLERQLTFYRDGKKSQMIASSILFTCSAMFYESFILMAIPIGVMALFSMDKEKHRTFRKVILELRYHIVFLSVYLLVYFGFRILNPSGYDGTVFGSSDLLLSLRTIFTFSVGLFPLRPFLDLPHSMAALKNVDPLIIAVALAGAFATGIAIYNMKAISRRTALQMTFLCGLGIVLPNVLLGFTLMKALWVAGGSTSYVTSFYSFAFLVVLLSTWAGFLAPKFKRKWIPATLAVPALFVVLVMIGVSNKEYINICDNRLDRLETFAAVVETDSFATVQKGSIIYMPDSTGLHGNMDAMNVYTSPVLGKTYLFVNRKEDVTFSGPTYMLRYNTDTKTAMFGKIDENFISDEITYVNLEGVGSSSYLTKPDRILSDSENLGLYTQEINGREIGKETVVFTQEPYRGLISFVDPDATEVVVSLKDAEFPFICRVQYEDSSMDEAPPCPIDISFPYGFYAQENWPKGEARWASGDAGLVLKNTSDTRQSVVLNMTTATLLEEKHVLAIHINDQLYLYPVSVVPTELSLEIDLLPGETPITFSCDALPSGPPEDTRDLVFYIINLELTQD